MRIYIRRHPTKCICVFIFFRIPGRTVTINGHDYINVSSLNFLGLLGDKEIEKNAIAAVRRYGVGSCGPRGFYGTVGSSFSPLSLVRATILCFHHFVTSVGIAG